MASHRFKMHLLALFAAGLLTCGAASAKDSHRITLFDPMQLNGTTLPAGKYKVTWEQQNPEATVTFTSGKKIIATAKGKIVEREKSADFSGVVSNTNPDGTKNLVEIRFGGSKEAVVFDQSPSS